MTKLRLLNPESNVCTRQPPSIVIHYAMIVGCTFAATAGPSSPVGPAPARTPLLPSGSLSSPTVSIERPSEE